MTEFTLPELGEDITTGDVLRVLVAPGETLSQGQPVLELETDKATVEVPSSVSGTITQIKVKPGDRVTVGEVILTVDEAGAAAARPAAKRAAATGPARALDASEAIAAQVAEAPVAGPVEPPVASAVEPPVASPVAPRRRGDVVDISRAGRPSAGAAATPAAAAAPSVRRLARELGVDIDEVPGSGPAGRISVEDVKAHTRRLVTTGSAGTVARPLPDFSRWGPVERKPMSAVRRKTAERLAEAWSTIPHVTQHERADITSLEAFRKRFETRPPEEGGHMTITAILLKVIAAALEAFPQVCASVDIAAEEIILKKYIHVGVAVDTGRGLLVPVIRDVDRKGLIQLSIELAQAAERARTRQTTLEEMQGGSFTITNLGGIGGTYFSPIVNTPEVAILGVSRAGMQPVFVAGGFQPRLMLPLSLSYDHRVIDGADAIRFLRWIVDALEQPMLLTL